MTWIRKKKKTRRKLWTNCIVCIEVFEIFKAMRVDLFMTKKIEKGN
jgi:hypothetical protein